ncbi:MAG: hypothetical protein M1511_18470 [Deltaproteobacteria bacterium]|nr:hypothetical protein [Deltaproteobacteria bacterium]
MAQVKVLLWKIGFLTTLIILTCSIILVAAGWQKSNYLAATIDKQKLLKETLSPKVILVGGSSVAFGMDSEIIQHQLEVPVVNMGLQAGVGLNYMLQEVTPFIGRGDLVVVMPEYEQFYGELLNGNECVWDLIWYVPEGCRNLRSPGQYLALLKSFRGFLYARLVRLLHQGARVLGLHEIQPLLYRRSSFNGHGDFIAHLSLPPSWHGRFPTEPGSTLNDETFSALERFSKYVAGKRAQMVVVWPSVPEPFYLARKEWIQRITSKMTECPDIRVHGIPLDYVLPVNNFFDTNYHLTAAGRLKRTLEIARFLLQRNERPTANYYP